MSAKKALPKTLGELKSSGYKVRSVRQEMEDNLMKAIDDGTELFPGIKGYDETVLPQITNAILAHHDVVFIGEKGQAKSRLMRALASFLDDSIPVVEGCEINDDPNDPVCARCRRLAAEKGDDLPVAWLPKSKRYNERLAPGTKIADLIGDLDPAKVAGGSPLASEDALHFGLIPRTHRGIFGLNELPDLEYLVQVALFNILEENDFQIRGYPFRFPLDVVLVFTANPEEYTRAGKIISQLKDRIGAEIRTHYPISRELGIEIMEQEAHPIPSSKVKMDIPLFMKQIVEQITLEARNSPYVNQKSGVSARLSIANYENLIANCRRRAALLGEREASPRISDLAYLGASTSGKVELDPFREETVTESKVIGKIFDKAILTVFKETLKNGKLEGVEDEIKGEEAAEISDMKAAKEYKKIISKFPQLWEPVENLGEGKTDAFKASCLEFLLEGLHLSGKLSRKKVGSLITYRDKAKPRDIGS